jgi:hypothetical protein
MSHTTMPNNVDIREALYNERATGLAKEIQVPRAYALRLV